MSAWIAIALLFLSQAAVVLYQFYVIRRIKSYQKDVKAKYRELYSENRRLLELYRLLTGRDIEPSCTTDED